jgi:hypothetical protein
MMKKLLCLIGILFFTLGCLDTNSSKGDDIARLFGLSGGKTSGSKQVLKLSIQGELKDGAGKPMSYKLMSTGQGINSAADVRQATTSRVRFIDYSLEPGVLTGLFIIQNEADETSIDKYSLYWGDETQKSFLAGFTKTGKKIQFGLTKVKKSAYAQKFFLYAEGKKSPEAALLESNLIQDTAAGTITGKDGKFELVLIAGQKTDVNIQDPLTNLASFSVDLTSIDSLEKMQALEKSIAEKGFTDGFLALYVKVAGSLSMSGQIFVIGASDPSNTGSTTDTSTAETPIDLNSVVTTAQADNPEPPSTFTIQANIVGLTGTGLVLQNNGTDNLPVSADGSITFPKSYASGSTYSVTILTQPTNQTCTLTGSTGVLTTNAVVVANCASNQNDITAFSFVSPAVTGTISGTTISLAVPFGTNVTSLVPTFSTTGASVNVGGVAQTSGITAGNFTSPQNYTVTAADGTTKVYTVSVTIGPNSAKDITAFNFVSPAVTGTIIGTTISLTVPFGTNVTSLVPTFSTTGASVNVGGVAQTSGITAGNFTSPLNYTVTAADGTTKVYTVSVTIGPDNAKDITAFSFVSPAVTGTISETNITVSVPYNTTVTSLVATFILSGGSVTIGGTPQVSGTTVNNFTSPLTYRVTAGDGSTKDYTVTVTVSTNNPPIATGVVITGTVSLGQTLTGSFSFSDPDGHSAGTHTYQWYRCTDNSSVGTCASISGATSTAYTVSTADDNKYIRFGVTPRDQHGLSGTLVYSNATILLDCLQPTLSNNLLRITQLDSGSATFSWTAATDTVTPQSNLQYILYYSENPAMNTVAEIEANGIPVGDYTTNILSKQVTGLVSNKVYYFTVIVQDSAGFKTAYKVHKDFTYTNMVAYYPMNANTLAGDISGTGNNGTIEGSVTQTTDKDGNANSAYNFNGTNGVIVIANNPSLALTPANGYTIMAWIKPVAISGINGIVSKYHSASANGYVFRLNSGKLDLDQIITGSTVSVDTWYHVAATRTGSTIVLYIDGVATTASGTILAVETNTDPLRIGQDYSTDIITPRYFNGSIDDVRVYNKALTQAEVQNISGKKYTFSDNQVPAGWESSGNASWFVTPTDCSTVTGVSAPCLRSGVISDSQTTSISATITVTNGAISFHRKVVSELNYDKCEFKLDGVAQTGEPVSGVVDQYYSFPTSNGSHTVEWRYYKDGSNATAPDACFIDNISY